jgi:hypothetical protein
MLPILVEAATNFCIHQIRLPYHLSPSSLKKRTLLAYIDIETAEGEIHRAFIGCDETLIQTITSIFLGEENSDEETLVDMLLETTNMIVGNAKVLAGELYQTAIRISTPLIVSQEEIEHLCIDEQQRIGVDGGEMMIGLQRL